MTSNITKLELRFYKFGGFKKIDAWRCSRGLIIDLGDHVPFNGDFGSLEELNDLGNILELFKRRSGMVSFGFLDELKY
jgi:hypothetical protein